MSKSKDSSKDRTVSRRNLLLAGTTLAAASAMGSAAAMKVAQAQQQPAARRPNILVIFGDDIGMWNIGACCNGMMGKTPNIDRIAKEGILFMDHYGQPSCTAGRAAFIVGQLPVRTGMKTVGIPGSARGVQKSDPTLAEVLKAEGYATAQFSKNHLGDRNEFLPTVHGFDYWFGNLYHPNAEEEPEELDYPRQKNPRYKQQFGPRGVLRAFATDVDDRPLTQSSDASVSKRSRTQVRLPANAWRPSTQKCWPRRSNGWTPTRRATSRFSCGSTHRYSRLVASDSEIHPDGG